MRRLGGLRAFETAGDTGHRTPAGGPRPADQKRQIAQTQQHRHDGQQHIGNAFENSDHVP